MGKNDSKATRVPEATIKEVEEFLDIQEELVHLKAAHPEVFRAYGDLIDRYNTALEAAEQKVRSKGVSCGPFTNYSVQVKIDASKMYEELGKDMFLSCGGSITQRTVYEVDRPVVEAAIARNEIPEECLPHFRKTQRNYRKPDKLTRP